MFWAAHCLNTSFFSLRPLCTHKRFPPKWNSVLAVSQSSIFFQLTLMTWKVINCSRFARSKHPLPSAFFIKRIRLCSSVVLTVGISWSWKWSRECIYDLTVTEFNSPSTRYIFSDVCNILIFRTKIQSFWKISCCCFICASSKYHVHFPNTKIKSYHFTKLFTEWMRTLKHCANIISFSMYHSSPGNEIDLFDLS